MNVQTSLVFVLFTCSACQANGSDPAFWDPAPRPGQSSDDDGSSSGAGGGATTTGKLSLDITTVSYGGEYGPTHVSAFWIEDVQGQFVKTLEIRAAKRLKYLTRWGDSSQGSVVDAITGASLDAHKMRTIAWDLTDAAGEPVPYGEYQIVAEFSEHNGPGYWSAIAFEVSANPLDIQADDIPGFQSRKLVLSP